MDCGRVPDLPPVADESKVNVDSNENPTPIENAEGRTGELPKVDNETGADTDLNGSPAQTENAEETPEEPTQDELCNLYFWLLKNRSWLQNFLTSPEAGLEGTEQGLKGDPIPIVNSEETLSHNETVMTDEDILKCLEMNAKLQKTEAAHVTVEASLQMAEPYAASSDVQTQIGPTQLASDCWETNKKDQTDESKSLSNVTPEPSTRNPVDNRFYCEGKRQVKDIGVDTGRLASILASGARNPSEAKILNAFRGAQCDVHMLLARNEERMRQMTDLVLRRGPSTSTESQSDASADQASATVQSVPGSSTSSSRLQRKRTKTPSKKQKKP